MTGRRLALVRRTAGFVARFGSGDVAGLDIRRQLPHQRSAGNLDHQIFSGGAVHAFAQAHYAVLRQQAGLIILGDEVVEVVIGFQDHLAAAAAVAAARPPLRAIFLTLEGDAALAAVARPRVNPDLIDEHCLSGR